MSHGECNTYEIGGECNLYIYPCLGFSSSLGYRSQAKFSPHRHRRSISTDRHARWQDGGEADFVVSYDHSIEGLVRPKTELGNSLFLSLV